MSIPSSFFEGNEDFSPFLYHDVNYSSLKSDYSAENNLIGSCRDIKETPRSKGEAVTGQLFEFQAFIVSDMPKDLVPKASRYKRRRRKACDSCFRKKVCITVQDVE